jgi:hypothetical protein
VQDSYTKFIIQTKIATSKDDIWYDYDDYPDTLEEAQEAMEFYRGVHKKTHVFRIVKRDYETIDTIIEEKASSSSLDELLS